MVLEIFFESQKDVDNCKGRTAVKVGNGFMMAIIITVLLGFLASRVFGSQHLGMVLLFIFGCSFVYGYNTEIFVDPQAQFRINQAEIQSMMGSQSYLYDKDEASLTEAEKIAKPMLLEAAKRTIRQRRIIERVRSNNSSGNNTVRSNGMSISF